MATTPKDARLDMRLSQQEREMFDILADRHGLTVASYIRNLMHSAYRREIEQGEESAA